MALHWLLIVHTSNHTVSGQCSDGRMFVEPHSSQRAAKHWIRGFCAAGRMVGWTFEFTYAP
jgi:hypothetical protein